MHIFGEIKTLIYKELLLEWRQRYALNGLLLYVLSAVMIVYLSFNLSQSRIEPIVWNALFWIILLFAAVNAIAKSFMQERSGRLLYYYLLASPEAIVLSKILYNIFLMTAIAAVALGSYSMLMGNPVQDMPLFLLNLLLGALGFSATFTMVAGIASKAHNNATLMAVLSFPIIVPMLLLLLKVSKNAMDGLDRTSSFNELLSMGAMNLIVVITALLLFPFLWKS